MSANTLFSLEVGGSLVSEAVVQSAEEILSGVQAAQFLADHRDGARFGVAVANPSNQPISVVVLVADLDGQEIGNTTVSLPANDSKAFFLDDLVTIPTGHTGQVVLGATGSLHAIGLRFTGLVFTTIPATVSQLSTTPVPPSPAKPFNQQQTERLIGTWEFTYTIISDFKNTYRLNDVRGSSSKPGEWNIFGTDEYGGIVVAGYAPSIGEFSLLGSLGDIQQFFTFDFVGSNTVSGCYYHDIDVSDCFPMTGVKTSLSTRALSRGTSALSYATAVQAQAELAKTGEAENFGNEMQIEVDPKIISALEALREVLRQ